MARGNNVSIPSGSGTLQKTLFSERQTILVLNPNNGILYVKMQAPADPVTWDFVVPSQSRAYLPGPWLEYGLWYVDQSGGGATGNVTVFESDQRIDMPDYAAIGVARLVQASSMDIVEGAVPANPGAGILRLWADSGDHLHRLGPSGADSAIPDFFTPLGGSLGGFLPNPSIANGAVNALQLAANSVSIALDGAAVGIPFSTTSAPYVPVGTFTHNVSSGSQYFLAKAMYAISNTVQGAFIQIYLGLNGGASPGGISFHIPNSGYWVAGTIWAFYASPPAGTMTIQLYVATNTGTTTIQALDYETLELRR